jgi:hypothetical protein
MGDHMHGSGEWMISYRYMHMEMKGSRSGTDRISTPDILSQFMMAPLEMSMDMHMLGIMYAPSDKLTLMGMTSQIEKEMSMQTRMGMNFTTRTSGVGDTKLSGLYKIWTHDDQQIHLNFGFSLPTGSIDERGNTPMGANQKLPYPMQLGSGSFDLLPGITYLGKKDPYSWGAQLSTVLRLDENDNNYRFGNRTKMTGWVSTVLTHWLSGSLRINAESWGNIHGADSELNPMMAQTTNPSLQGGERIDILAGLNFLGQDGLLKGHRLSLEFGVPLYQKLDGPQMETDWTSTLGYQYAF